MKFPTEEHPLMVIELFAGIGAQAMALKNSGIPHRVVAISEIDKNAIQSYMAIHGETPNLGDISLIEELPYFPDNPTLWTYSFPCQDISVAGLQRGFTENTNTRSSLLWEVHRLVKKAVENGHPPDYLLMENVDAILNEKNLPNFNKWIARLSDMGYTSSYAVLNSKNFGVPQNRKRCFMMSARDGMKFIFDEGTPTTVRLKDILETDVDESFYLSDERIAKYEQKCTPQTNAKPKEDVEDDGNIIVSGDLKQDGRFESANRTYNPDGISPTIPTCGGGGIVPKIEVEGAEIKVAGEMTNKSFNQSRQVYDTDGIAPTVCARDYKEPAKIQVAGDLHLEKISKGGKRNNHSNDVLDTEGISTCVLASAGEGGGHVPKIEVVGNLHDDSRLEQHNRVHGTDGISPTINTVNEAPIIIEDDPGIEIAGKMADTKVEQAARVYDPDGLSPAITAGGGTGSIAKIEIAGNLHDESRPEMHNRIYDSKGIAPTLCANGGSEPAPKIEVDGAEIKVAGEIDSEFASARKVLSPEGIAPTIMTTHFGIAMPKVEVIEDVEEEQEGSE